MENRVVGSILTAAGVLTFALVPLAQRPSAPASERAKAIPDLSGIWNASGGALVSGPGAYRPAPRDGQGGIPSNRFTREEPPMQPSALQSFKAARAGRGPEERPREQVDQLFYPYCMPHGFPRVYTTPLALEIVQTTNQVYMLFEASNMVRRIYLDGRKHLEGWVPTFTGVSHGKWDGDTLVVETDNILSLDGHSWIDSFGHPFSDSLRVTERIRRVSHDSLQIDLLFDDPKTYTKPWGGRKLFQLQPTWDMTDYEACEDHLREDFLRDLRAGKPAGRP